MKNVGFLIYNNRSGSTYLSALLDNFEEIGVSLESPVFTYLLTGRPIYRTESEIRTALAHIYMDRKFKEWEVPEQELETRLFGNLPLTIDKFIHILLEAYFDRIKPGASYWICKIGNPYLIRRINRIFHDAKFIFIYRDGRAVFCSQRKAFSRNAGDVMEKDPIRSARTWLKYIGVVNSLKTEANILTVKYEDLILDTEKELGRIYQLLTGRSCDKKKIEIESSSYYRKIPRSQSHLHHNVGNNPLKSRIDAWKDEIKYPDGYLYEREARLMLNELGYETIFYQTGRGKIFSHFLLYRLSLTWGRIINRIIKLKYFFRHPEFAWKRIMTRLETRYWTL